MGSLPAELKSKLRADTRAEAELLLEDLHYFRTEIARDETSKAELRRLSVTARRLIVNRELNVIATPRIGKIEIIAPDYTEAYALTGKVKHIKFFAGGARVFGVGFGPLLLVNAGQVAPENLTKLQEKLGHYERKATLRLEGFLNQRVLCLEDTWLSRGDAIKMIANLGSGAHSGIAKEPSEKLLARIRSEVFYTAVDGGVNATMFRGDPHWEVIGLGMRVTPKPEVDLSIPPIDAVLLEVLAAAQCVVESPRVIELESMIREEIGLAPAASIEKKIEATSASTSSAS